MDEEGIAYIGALLLEAKENEMNVCGLRSLAIGVWVGCWWGLNEGKCQD
jgi:hypothetical protein